MEAHLVTQPRSAVYDTPQESFDDSDDDQPEVRSSHLLGSGLKHFRREIRAGGCEDTSATSAHAQIHRGMR